MSYVVEELNDCSSKFIFDLENVDLSSQIEKVLLEKQKKANLKGFRKGKVPLSIVSRMYKDEAQKNALMEVVSRHIFDVLEEKKISSLGTPQLVDLNYDQDSCSVKFQVVVEYIPSIAINDYSHLKFEKEKSSVSNEDVEKLINGELEQLAQLVEIKDVALDKGHTAVIDFQGEKENGERPENMKGEEHLLEIGSNTFIPGFEDALTGHEEG